MKVYGQLEKAQLENLSADPASTAEGYIYWDTVGKTPKWYTGTGWTSAATGTTSSLEIANVSIACSVASNALTIALKTQAGSDPSVGSPVKIGFRSSTTATGTYNQRSVTAALSVVVSSGSTLGHTSGNEHLIYVYALDNAGTVELAVSQTLFSDYSVQSTTAEGGAGASDSNRVLYSSTARSSVPIRLLARLKSTQTTAGTWAAAPTEISLCSSAIAASDRVTMLATTASGATITNGADTNIVFGTKVIDTHGCYDTSTGIWTAPRAGYIFVVGSLYASSAAWSLNDIFRFSVYKNGNSISFLERFIIPNTTAAIWGARGSYGPMSVAEGDQIRLVSNLTCGTGNKAIQADSQLNFFGIQLL
jgi:hypothetical protein